MVKHEQTIQSLAELVAEQWETIQQKRNYIEYLESELSRIKSDKAVMQSDINRLCNDVFDLTGEMPFITEVMS